MEVNNMLINNEWVNNEIKEDNKRHLEKNENENTAVQSMWTMGKAILKWKFITLQSYLKKQRKN